MLINEGDQGLGIWPGDSLAAPRWLQFNVHPGDHMVTHRATDIHAANQITQATHIYGSKTQNKECYSRRMCNLCVFRRRRRCEFVMHLVGGRRRPNNWICGGRKYIFPLPATKRLHTLDHHIARRRRKPMPSIVRIPFHYYRWIYPSDNN